MLNDYTLAAEFPWHQEREAISADKGLSSDIHLVIVRVEESIYHIPY